MTQSELKIHVVGRRGYGADAVAQRIASQGHQVIYLEDRAALASWIYKVLRSRIKISVVQHGYGTFWFIFFLKIASYISRGNTSVLYYCHSYEYETKRRLVKFVHLASLYLSVKFAQSHISVHGHDAFRRQSIPYMYLPNAVSGAGICANEKWDSKRANGTVLLVGRNVKLKNFSFVATNLTMSSKLRILHAGDIGPEGNIVGVEHLGHLPSEALCERFLETSLLIVPSEVEASPNVVLEALQLGVPFIASEIRAHQWLPKKNLFSLSDRDRFCKLVYEAIKTPKSFIVGPDDLDQLISFDEWLSRVNCAIDHLAVS